MLSGDPLRQDGCWPHVLQIRLRWTVSVMAVPSSLHVFEVAHEKIFSESPCQIGGYACSASQVRELTDMTFFRIGLQRRHTC